MTDKELKRLKRVELLEIMYMQSQRIEELELKLAEAERQLESRAILLEEAGNIAEASLQLNGIFEAAQAAADQYIMNVKKQFDSVIQTDGMEEL